MALGNPRVDLLSLDVEGAEVPILRTIPWNRVDIRVIMVEFNHSKKDEIKALLEANGYVLKHTGKIDLYFVKKATKVRHSQKNDAFSLGRQYIDNGV